ncbi:hypothetical protein [Dactylosporangium sp. CS-033363]|uniref:hypothetical protein n=1 Tax=Dactylosporangium sp. CS-033363 TaxID=3239935 RepID=UPI003D9320AC
MQMTKAERDERHALRVEAVDAARGYRYPKDVLRAYVWAIQKNQIDDAATTAEEWASIAGHYVGELGILHIADKQMIQRLALVIIKGTTDPDGVTRNWAWPGPVVSFLPQDIDVETVFRLADMLRRIGVPSAELLLRHLHR